MEPDYKNLPDEMKFDLALRFDYKTLIDYCKTSSEFLEGICGNNYFWKKKTYYDFEDLYDIEPTKILYGVADLYEDFEEGDWWETYQYYRSVFSRNFIEHLQTENVKAILDDLDLIEEREFLIVDEKTQRKGGSGDWLIDALERWDITALMAAIEKGYEDIADFLLAEGADIEAKDNNGDTILIRASKKDLKDAVEFSLSKGANTNAKNNGGWTAIMYSIMEYEDDIADILLAKGADINAKNDEGETILMIASKYSQDDSVEMSLERGADVNVRDNKGMTALLHASKRYTFWGIGKLIVDLLLSKGADINAKDEAGKTALILAISSRPPSRSNLYPFVKFLLENGAEVNVRDNEGKTALTYASEKEVVEDWMTEAINDIVELLRRYGAR